MPSLGSVPYPHMYTLWAADRFNLRPGLFLPPHGGPQQDMTRTFDRTVALTSGIFVRYKCW